MGKRGPKPIRLNEQTYINRNGKHAKCWLKLGTLYGNDVVYVRTSSHKYQLASYKAFASYKEARAYQLALLKKAKNNTIRLPARIKIEWR
jgi:hypothetical protein